VVKKDGSRVPFDRENILRGILAACGKRPVAEQSKEDLVEQIERELRHDFDREVPSAEIGQRVATGLRGLDQIAYIRYASEYHGFESLSDLAEEVTNLQQTTTDDPGQQDLFKEQD
jgi:transcriptional repressor NrdR